MKRQGHEENGSERGLEAPASDLPVGAEGMAAILGMVASRSLDHRGGLSLDSVSLESLRTQEGREALLREFVVAMMPDRVNPTLWLRWLDGTAKPFERVRVARPDPADQSLGRALDRQSKRVGKAVLGVQNARRSREAAERREREAEQALIEARALDAAMIEYAVSEHLLAAMAPMFAMGPAWTVMRALSGHVPVEEMEEELRLERNPNKRSELEAVVRRERQEETDRVMDALDYWAGDVHFEREVRDAVAGVVKGYEGRSRPDASRRSRASMREGVADGELVRDKGEIIDGLKRGGA